MLQEARRQMNRLTPKIAADYEKFIDPTDETKGLAAYEVKKALNTLRYNISLAHRELSYICVTLGDSEDWHGDTATDLDDAMAEVERLIEAVSGEKPHDVKVVEMKAFTKAWMEHSAETDVTYSAMELEVLARWGEPVRAVFSADVVEGSDSGSRVVS